MIPVAGKFNAVKLTVPNAVLLTNPDCVAAVIATGAGAPEMVMLPGGALPTNLAAKFAAIVSATTVVAASELAETNHKHIIKNANIKRIETPLFKP